MTEQNIQKAVAYYKAMNAKNIPLVLQDLANDIHFISPLANIKGKEHMAQAVERFIGFFKSISVQDSCGSDNRVMLVYDIECPAPIGNFRTAVLMNFENGLISRIELFFDARVLEKKS